MKRFLILMGLAFMLAGCLGPNQAQTVGRTLATTAATADSTMKGWAIWSVTHPVDPVKEADVRKAYANYQLYMNLAKSAYHDLSIAGDQEAMNEALKSLSEAATQLNLTVNLLKK